MGNCTNIYATATIRIDEDDYNEVRRYKWNISSRGYVISRMGGKNIQLHNLVLPPLPGKEVDHINGNKLDNRKSNLRYSTRAQNCWNTPARKRREKKSKYKGVSIDSHTGLWRSEIAANGEHYRSRRFHSEIEAAKWYDEMAKKLHGDFAWINLRKTKTTTD